MKYILVSGGVISGIGKGVISSSIGTLLKAYGIPVTAIKIDPYLNIDAGTFSPYEHGEVFVLDDGGEVDLDLGNYERFLNAKLKRDNNITTGKIYQDVISRERRGDYLGTTVQVVPHVTDTIMDWVQKVAQIPVNGTDDTPEVCIIELGGTIGDIEGMPFVEAFRQFQFRVGMENFCTILVSLVPQPSGTGEQKTKPTQHSVQVLRGKGLTPDLIMCRSKDPLAENNKLKVSNFCQVPPQQVISVHDVSSIYRVPFILESQNVPKYLFEKFKINHNPHPVLREWKILAEKNERLHQSCKIAMVGKYTKLQDAYASVIKALKHSALAVNRKLDLLFIEAEDLQNDVRQQNPVRYHEAWKQLVESDGILVPGGFGSRGVEGKILAAKWARENQIPYLGVCLGLQVAVIEFARNVLNLENANSAEIDPNTEHKVVIEMPEHNQGNMGGTMRLGKRRTLFKTDDSILRKLYNPVGNYIDERHRHRYEVNPEFVERFEDQGLIFVGHDEDGVRMEVAELTGHPFYVAVQFHPEFLSRPLHPSPPYLGLLLAASGKLESYIERGGRLSPRDDSFILSSDDDAEIYMKEESSKSLSNLSLSATSNQTPTS